MFAPIPSASVATAVSVNPGLFESVRIAYLSYYEDPVIGMAFNGLDGAAFKALQLAASDPIAAEYPERFRRFMRPGTKHVLLFDLPSVDADGVRLSDWLEAFADDVDAGWPDLHAAGS